MVEGQQGQGEQVVGALVLLVLRPLQLLVLRLLELVALRLLQLLVLRFLVLVALRLLWCYGPTVFGAMLLAKSVIRCHPDDARHAILMPLAMPS